MKSYGKGNVTLEFLITSDGPFKLYYFHVLPEIALYVTTSANEWDVRFIFGFLCFRLTILIV